MSATGRNLEGNGRLADDAYMTPPWCVRRLMEVIDLPGGRWIEPAAGNGQIIAHVPPMGRDQYGPPGGQLVRRWTAVEKRSECVSALLGLTADTCLADFLTMEFGERRFEVAITNPPFSLAFEFYKRCREIAAHTILLTRLNFLASQVRAEAFREDAPNVFVLPNRPSFTGKGTDATEYAWLHWPPERRKVGSLRVCATTSAEERAFASTVRELGPTP